MSCSTRNCGCADGRPLARSLRSPRVLIALGMIFASAACAVFAGWIAPHDPGEQNLLSILTPPAWATAAIRVFRWAPTAWPRVLSPLIYGARTAMLVALLASLGAMVIGSILAHIAGYFGGIVDWIIGRLVDVWMSFPAKQGITFGIGQFPVFVSSACNDQWPQPVFTSSAVVRVEPIKYAQCRSPFVGHASGLVQAIKDGQDVTMGDQCGGLATRNAVCRSQATDQPVAQRLLAIPPDDADRGREYAEDHLDCCGGARLSGPGIYDTYYSGEELKNGFGVLRVRFSTFEQAGD